MSAKPTAINPLKLPDPFDPRFSPESYAEGKSHFQITFFFVFSAARRRALRDFYAFCRLADDFADQEAVPLQERLDRLQSLRRWASLSETKNHPFWDDFRDSLKRYRVSPSSLAGILDGVSYDLHRVPLRFETWDELNAYVYGVACCVGEAVLCILGADGPEAKSYALHMGRCLQYLNIMRDLEEDWEHNRLYVPNEFLKSIGEKSDALPTTEKLEIIRKEFFERALQSRRQANPYSWKCLPAELMGAVYLYASQKYWRWGRTNRLSKWEKLSALAQMNKKF